MRPLEEIIDQIDRRGMRLSIEVHHGGVEIRVQSRAREIRQALPSYVISPPGHHIGDKIAPELEQIVAAIDLLEEKR